MIIEEPTMLDCKVGVSVKDKKWLEPWQCTIIFFSVKLESNDAAMAKRQCLYFTSPYCPSMNIREESDHFYPLDDLNREFEWLDIFIICQCSLLKEVLAYNRGLYCDGIFVNSMQFSTQIGNFVWRSASLSNCFLFLVVRNGPYKL